MGKRTRSLVSAANEPAQKKPPQNSLAYDRNPEPAQDTPPAIRTRNQDREKEVEDEVKRSCQNIQWTRGPLPKNIDHWFYDLRNAGTVPPISESCCSVKGNGAQVEKCSREQLLSIPLL
jgi:hypothetical protein